MTILGNNIRRKLKEMFRKLQNNYSLMFFCKILIVFIITFIGIGLCIAFFCYKSFNSLGEEYIRELKNIAIVFCMKLVKNLPKMFFYFYVLVFAGWSLFHLFYFIKNKDYKHIGNNEGYHTFCYTIFALFIVIFHLYVELVWFLFGLFFIELIFSFQLIKTLIFSDKIELKNILILDNNNQNEKNRFISLYSIIYLLIIIFIIFISIDYTLVNLTNGQKKILIDLFLDDRFFVIGKLILHVKDLSSKELMYNTILQLSSVFITFMGFIMGFLSQSIYSINIHMIINWKYNQIMMLYYRMSTIVIVILSFFISNSRYTFTMLYLDIYMIWIILYNLYIISSIFFQSSLTNIFYKRVILDMESIRVICDKVETNLALDKNTFFYQEYLKCNGKSIFLPLSLLMQHINVNKDEGYQMILVTLTKTIVSLPFEIKENIILIVFVLERMILSFFDNIEKNINGQCIIDDIDIMFLIDILNIINENFGEINVNSLSVKSIIIGFILCNIAKKIDNTSFLKIISTYNQNRIGVNATIFFNIDYEVWFAFYILILFDRTMYFSLIKSVIEKLNFLDIITMEKKLSDYLYVINTYYYFHEIPSCEFISSDIEKLKMYISI